MKELLLNGCQFALRRLAYPCLRPLQGGLRGNDQPALGHAIMTKSKALRASRIVDGLPGGLPQRLADDLRHELAGPRNPRAKAELLELCRMGFAVELAIGNEITRGGRVPKGRKQCFGSIWENLGIGGLAVPTRARQWPPAVLGDHELQHRLFPGRPMVFGVARGDRHGLLITVGEVRAAERKTRSIFRTFGDVSCAGILQGGPGGDAVEYEAVLNCYTVYLRHHEPDRMGSTATQTCAVRQLCCLSSPCMRRNPLSLLHPFLLSWPASYRIGRCSPWRRGTSMMLPPRSRST